MQGNNRSNRNPQRDRDKIDIMLVITKQHIREFYALYIGDHPMLAYQGIAENESLRRQWYNIIQLIVSAGSSIGEARSSSGRFHNMSDDPDSEIPKTDTDTSDSDTDISDSNTDTSKILSDAILSPQVLSSRTQKAEALPVDQEESMDPNLIVSTSRPYQKNVPGNTHANTSDTVPYHENVPGTSDTRSYRENTSGASKYVVMPYLFGENNDSSEDEDKKARQEKFKRYEVEYNQLSNMKYFSNKTFTGDEVLPVDQGESSDPSISVLASRPYQQIMPGTSHAGTADTIPYHENMAGTSGTRPYYENMPGTSDTLSDPPVFQPIRPSPSRTENASPMRPPSREG